MGILLPCVNFRCQVIQPNEERITGGGGMVVKMFYLIFSLLSIQSSNHAIYKSLSLRIDYILIDYLNLPIAVEV